MIRTASLVSPGSASAVPSVAAAACLPALTGRCFACSRLTPMFTTIPPAMVVGMNYRSFRSDSMTSSSYSAVLNANQQRRLVSSLAFRVWDMVRTASLNPPNPLLVQQQQRQEEQNDAVNEEQHAVIDFSTVQPHHLVDAAKQVREEYMTNLQALKETLLKEQEHHDEEEMKSAEWLLDQLEQLESPTDFVHNTAAVYQSMMELPDWEHAARQAAAILKDKPHEQSALILTALLQRQQRLTEKDHSKNDDDKSSDSTARSGNVTARALSHHVNRYRHRGVVEQIADEREEERDGESSSVLQQIQSLQESLEEIEHNFLSSTSSLSSTVDRRHGMRSGNMASLGNVRQRLQDMYSMINIKTQQAKLMGYDNYVDHVLAAENRMATSRDEIEALHKVVKETFGRHTKATSLVKYPDTQSYLSLDGVLLGMFALARAMFGIVFHESLDTPRGWHSDVRLFEAMDETTGGHLGKLYLDALFRGPKVRRSLVAPLDRRSVVLAMSIPPPAWDDQPTPLKFRDALSLVHEFGHVLQFMLAKNRHGVAAQYMPKDASEMLPQLMENFLLEEPILQTLAHVSGAAEPFPSDLVEQLQKQHEARKIQIMNERAFLGQLELEVFSGGDESLVSLQRRLAQEYVPHELPDKNDLTPLFNVMSDSANDLNVCRYRYLYGEVMSSDIFTLFREAGVEDQGKMRELGMRLREAMVEPGGLLDGTAFRAFRGRDISPDAMLAFYDSQGGGDSTAVSSGEATYE